MTEKEQIESWFNGVRSLREKALEYHKLKMELDTEWASRCRDARYAPDVEYDIYENVPHVNLTIDMGCDDKAWLNLYIDDLADPETSIYNELKEREDQRRREKEQKEREDRLKAEKKIDREKELMIELMKKYGVEAK
jgi:hypothetical protein